jgi:hypothetical protein
VASQHFACSQKYEGNHPGLETDALKAGGRLEAAQFLPILYYFSAAIFGFRRMHPI